MGCRTAAPVAYGAPVGPGAMIIALCEDYPEESRSPAAAEVDLDALRRLGVSTLRVALGWDAIEHEPEFTTDRSGTGSSPPRKRAV